MLAAAARRNNARKELSGMREMHDLRYVMIIVHRNNQEERLSGLRRAPVRGDRIPQRVRQAGIAVTVDIAGEGDDESFVARPMR
ncbi:MAG: hypothetical protein ABWZ54_06700, partial [Luteibacter sp.]